MASIPGTVSLTGAIAPNDSEDTYPTHFAKYGKGGYYSVATLDERNAIPLERLEEGLFVYVVDQDKTYVYKSGVWSINLKPITPATNSVLGGVKIGTGIPIEADGTISSFKYSNRIYVSPMGSDSNDGRSPETSFRTIKAAAKLASSTPVVESIYVATGEYLEDNPIYLSPGTAVIGDNLRRTIVKPLNEGRDFFWWSSGCYINYLVFQDYYFGGSGLLDTSNQVNDRQFPEDGLSFKLFPGHTLQRLPGVYKDGAGLIAFQRVSIINGAYDHMRSLNPTLVIPGGGETTCKRDIGYIVDAVANDLKAGGNVNSLNAGKAYRDANGELISTIAGEVIQTKQAFEKARELCKIAIMTVPQNYGQVVDTSNPGACTQVSNTIDNLFDLIISLIDGGDVPQYNSGFSYVLMDQEWIEILDIVDDTITIADLGKRGINNPITGENSTPAKHINGAVVSQAGRAFRYAVAFPDEGGYIGKGIVNVSGSSVTGTGTNFTVECFPEWKLKIGNNHYTIQTINSNTSITLAQLAPTLTNKSYRIVPKKEQIFLSPYIQNCSNISVLGNCFYDTSIQSYDADKTRAGGMLVDNAQLDNKTPIPSNVTDAFTQIVFGGIGFHLKNDAYAQLVSVFQVFDGVGVLSESGGYTSITNSATNFGDLGLVAIGFSNAAIPSFKDAIVTFIENVTKPNFNTTPTEILSSNFVSDSEGTKTKAIITVGIDDIGKFEAGQTITIEGHTSTPTINGTNVTITGINFSANSIEIVLNIPFPQTRVNGANTGTITITSGKLETKVTVNGFDENPLPNYVVKITGLAPHPSGLEYIVNEIKSELSPEGICIFSLQQTIPQATLNALPANRPIELRAPSTINSSSHTFEYVGSGINYTALPINGGRTEKSKQVIEINAGKCYVSATDQDGNFTVGQYFNVNLRTGQITFAGQLNLGVIDALELLGSPGVPIYEFVTSIRSQINAKNTALPSEKAVRDWVVSVLGSLFNKEPTTSGGTSASAGQLVQLTSEGIVDPSMVRIPVSNVYTVANEAARLVNSISGTALKPGDYVVQLNPAPATRYILTALPATNPDNWDLFSVDNFDASAIISGILSPARIASGTANSNTFASGGGTWLPVVQNLKSATNSPIQIGAQEGTTPVQNGNAGFIEVDINKTAFASGQTTGSSSIGVAGFAFTDFNVANSIVSIKNKFNTASPPLSFDNNTGTLSIPKATANVNGFLGSDDWTTFFNYGNRANHTGTQTSSTISDKGFPNGIASLDSNGKVPKTQINLNATDVGAIAFTEKGANGGVPTLDSNGKVPKTQINLNATDVGAIAFTEKGANGGVPTLDSNGKVPKTQINLNATDVGAIAFTEKGANNGVATLDGNGQVPNTQLPKSVSITALPTNTTGRDLLTSDNGTILEVTASTAVNINLPNNLSVGFNIIVVQKGAGQITFVTNSGAVLRHPDNHTKTAKQYSSATLYVTSNTTGTNAEYILSGGTAS